MAKRIIQECDLTKQEYDPEETVVITIKKKGKTKGRSYDLSPDAAAKLEQQLVAGSSAVLNSTWNFTSHIDTPIDSKEQLTLGDLDDTQFVAEKKAQLREAGILGSEEEPREVPESTTISKVLGVTNNKCNHINKGRIQTTIRSGKRFIYRKCNDCRSEIGERTKEEKTTYGNQKTPKDVRIRDL